MVKMNSYKENFLDTLIKLGLYERDWPFGSLDMQALRKAFEASAANFGKADIMYMPVESLDVVQKTVTFDDVKKSTGYDHIHKKKKGKLKGIR